jgi:hypothetical protein
LLLLFLLLLLPLQPFMPLLLLLGLLPLPPLLLLLVPSLLLLSQLSGRAQVSPGNTKEKEAPRVRHRNIGALEGKASEHEMSPIDNHCSEGIGT